MTLRDGNDTSKIVREAQWEKIFKILEEQFFRKKIDGSLKKNFVKETIVRVTMRDRKITDKDNENIDPE